MGRKKIAQVREIATQREKHYDADTSEVAIVLRRV
jgi:hypothetical protein